METELRIVLDGDGAFVRDGRLSLSLFLEPLRALLVAYQRTADGILRQTEDEEEGPVSTKVRAAAAALDLEIVAVKNGSLDLGFVARQQPAASARARRVDDLEAAAAERLLEDIEEERQGRQRNRFAREFLRKLPTEVKRQRYELTRDGKTVRSVEFSEMSLRTGAPPSSRIRVLSGTLFGACFEAGKEYLELKTEDSTARFKCSRVQLDHAVEIRTDAITCAVAEVPGLPSRVVWLRALSEKWRPSEDDLDARIYERWGAVFERLSK